MVEYSTMVRSLTARANLEELYVWNCWKEAISDGRY